ncbi:hypothetical protein PF003_g4578 [Phytophthora fragariae]|nr:hypothetical protein PF003_g4578 [Phytophthora fragariae]
MASPGKPGQPDECMVELRRRRRQNKAGHYILEYELRPEHARRRLQTEHAGAAPCGGKNVGDEERRWMYGKEYDRLLQLGRVVERSADGEDV